MKTVYYEVVRMIYDCRINGVSFETIGVFKDRQKAKDYIWEQKETQIMPYQYTIEETQNGRFKRNGRILRHD